jgi:hypothetical protein
LKNSISEGLQALVVLRLRGTPGEDMIAKTAQVWFVAIETWPVGWDEGLDKPRIREAFRKLAAICENWPSPATLRGVMPHRPELTKLNAPTSREMSVENRKRLDDLIARMKAKMLVNEPPRA